ncbi:MAG: hypothetical protein ACR2NZ_10740 [Rubripirellula sp.]
MGGNSVDIVSVQKTIQCVAVPAKNPTARESTISLLVRVFVSSNVSAGVWYGFVWILTLAEKEEA